MDKMKTVKNTGINLKEIYMFADSLKNMEIPVIMECENTIPVKLYYRPKECGWTGVAILKNNEIIDNERYCGLVLAEFVDVLEDEHENKTFIPSKKFDFVMYGTKIRGHIWNKLSINDLDMYIQNSLKESKFIFKICCMRTEDGINSVDNSPIFNLSEDISLKDYQMIVYLKEKTKDGVEFVYW